MSRIRTLKPEILEDEKSAALSDGAYRVFTGAIVLADDYGNLRASPAWLRGQIFWASPRTEEEVAEFTAELAQRGLVRLYSVAGQAYASITNWKKHQRVDNAGKPRVPSPEEADGIVRGGPPRVSASRRETPLDPDHRPRPRSGPPTTDPDRAPEAAAEVLGGLVPIRDAAALAADERAITWPQLEPWLVQLYGQTAKPKWIRIAKQLEPYSGREILCAHELATAQVKAEGRPQANPGLFFTKLQHIRAEPEAAARANGQRPEKEPGWIAGSRQFLEEAGP